MTRFRLLIYLHTSELQIYLSGSLLVKFFLINHWKKIRRQDYQIKSNQIMRMLLRTIESNTSQQLCKTSQIIMIKFNEDKCKQSTETQIKYTST